MTNETADLAARFIEDVRDTVRSKGLAAALKSAAGFHMRQKRDPAALASLEKAAGAAAIYAQLFAARGGGMVDGAILSEARGADHSQWWTIAFTNARPNALDEGDEYHSFNDIRARYEQLGFKARELARSSN